MTVFKNPFFWIPCLLFWINQLLEKHFLVFIPILHEYLDDLLAMPVVLGLTLFVFRKIHPLKENFTFSITQVLIGTIYFAVLFEILLPLWSNKYTSDPIDAIAYGIGAWVFYKYINKRSLT
jgi:hypothetical protein